MFCCRFRFSDLRVEISDWMLLNISFIFCKMVVIWGSAPSRTGCCDFDSRDALLGCFKSLVVGGFFKVLEFECDFV